MADEADQQGHSGAGIFLHSADHHPPNPVQLERVGWMMLNNYENVVLQKAKQGELLASSSMCKPSRWKLLIFAAALMFLSASRQQKLQLDIWMGLLGERTLRVPPVLRNSSIFRSRRYSEPELLNSPSTSALSHSKCPFNWLKTKRLQMPKLNPTLVLNTGLI